MGDDDIDPGTLSGDALTQWYRRSPQEIEQARQDAYIRRYNAFFGGASNSDPDPGFDRGFDQSGPEIDPGFSRDYGDAGSDVDPGFTWVQDGPNRLRSVPISQDGRTLPIVSLADQSDTSGAVLDKGLAGPDDGAELIDVGNPANRRLRREHAAKYGPWPVDPVTGRNYDVAHIVAKADGGTDTLDNIKPMHPDDHRAEHMRNGDFSRWALRRGSTPPSAPVPQPTTNPAAGSASLTNVPHLPSEKIPRFKAPGVGLISPFSDVLGMISGRIRTDSSDNFVSDMMGWPSQQDIREQNERIRRQFCPRESPGTICT